MEPEPGRSRPRLGSLVPRIPSILASTPPPPSMLKDTKGKKAGVGTDSKKHVRLQVDPREEEMISKLTELSLNKGGLRSGTGMVYDPIMAEPKCLWDSETPESPERVTTIMEKLQLYGLLDRCHMVQSRSASREELQLVHSPDYVDLMKSMENMDVDELKTQSEAFDLVYFHPHTYSASCVAVGSVLQLVDELMKGRIRNGLAIVRPPGHHAHEDTANSYCIFNTLAVAAVYARKVHGVNRVLIVDWDIYHGQGTQYIFEDDPSVLLFSIHRYEHGDFWPHLAESDCTTTGSGRGRGYNINVPWNKTGMSDADYYSAFHKLLLPIAHEYRPNLILVYAGFNSVLGDPQGCMLTTPACFAHLTHMLMPLAEGKVLLSLEGGFNLRATADATAACLKVLLGDSCPQLISIASPSQSAMESISAVNAVHRKYWKCLQNRELSSWRESQSFVEVEEQLDHPDETLDVIMAEVLRPLPVTCTSLLYDERMMEHHNLWDFQHPEQPRRISQIFARHQELGLTERCLHIHAQSATESQLEMCHGPQYISTLKATKDMTPRELHRQSCEYNSIFISPQSYNTALLAVGALFTVVEAVITGQVQNGVAIIRPPGHHAERDMACGFCLFNNVALAARFAQNLVGHKIKVLIIDWDVHHGNGTQHMFEDDPSVLYISIHRYDNGNFFPNSEDADFEKVGVDHGEGFTVNIPWNGARMGDSEYIAAFHRVVMPISYEFQPDLVLVSAGFDAARGDPLGGCEVTPECYAHMTHMIMSLAGGRVVFALEGGYNLTATSESMAMCTQTLLGDTPPYLEPMSQPANSAAESINNVISVHHKYWASLRLLSPELDVQSKSKGTAWSQQPPAAPLPTQEPRVQVSQSRRTSMWLQQQVPLVNVVEAEPQTSQSRRTSLWTQQSPGLGIEAGETVPEFGKIQPMHNVPTSHGPPSAEEDTIRRESAHRVPIWSQQLPPAQRPEVSDLQQPMKPLWPQEPQPSPLGVMPMDLPSVSNTNTLAVPDLRVTGSFIRRAGAKPKVKIRKSSSTKVIDDPDASSSGSSSKLKGTSEEEIPDLTTRGRCPEPSQRVPPSSGVLTAVTPLHWCPHLKTVRPVPAEGLNVTTECEECQSETENWVCLCCYKVYCGRYVNEHMMIHGLKNDHLMVLSFTDLSVWCYGCDAYVHNEVLLPAKTEAHRNKFGRDPPK